MFNANFSSTSTISWSEHILYIKLMEGQTTQWPKKGQKDEQTVYKTLHRKLKIEQHELHKTTGVNAGATEGEAVPRTLTLAYLYV